GTAAYILQKSPDFAAAPQELVVDDLIVAVVKEGQSIIVPPNYGHCSINIGDGPLVFSNLAYKPCTVHYDTVQFYHGMACYIVEENGQLCVRKNHYYPRVPRIKFATVKENPHLGITFDMPLYQRYRAAPERFHFLGHVDNYVREIMGMLQYEDDLFPLCQEDA
ncbi:cytoplasmic protein, partial [Salmonella enterica subsp. enterica serovar Goldcoast]|nr:cytoplasmic protein [Salmonella enterica subsp. enterica serovar Goldcoast]